MAREYSKRSSKRGISLPQQVLVMVVTFVLGYFTASIFDVDALSHWMTTQVLENHEARPAVATAPATKEQLPPKPKFEFYTLLANEKGLKANQGAARAPNTTAQQKPSSVNGVTTPSTTVVSAATNSTRIAVTKPIRPTAKPVQVVAAKPIAVSPPRGGNFVVQVASFKARQDAEHMKGLLILKGFEVNVVPVATPQGNWFRVVIGPYPNRTLAQKAQVILAKTERLNGMVRSAS